MGCDFSISHTSSNAILALLSDVAVQSGTCGMTLSAAGKVPDRG